jgi:hypothetical protein
MIEESYFYLSSLLEGKFHSLRILMRRERGGVGVRRLVSEDLHR